MIDEQELAPHDLLVLRLRGNQTEMGVQQGALLRAAGGYEEASRFYPSIAARMLSLGVPYRARKGTELVASHALRWASEVMHRARKQRFPAYVARTEALLRAGSLPSGQATTFLGWEMLENLVGWLGKLGALDATNLSLAAVPACSSLVVWGSASEDRTLRHARNFDFPGAGVWDHAPSVVFCTPDQGLRYGFVTTRGADVPGITAFNEAGLTLTVHTRFHCDVRLDGAAVFDLGHEIVRRAKTLSEAIDLARKHPSASPWGIVVSSAREASAVIIETTGRAVEPVFPHGGASHLACTNRYLSARLKTGEITTSDSFVVDSDARFARLEEAVREATDGLSVADLEALLGDYRACFAEDGRPETQRLAGDCVVSPISVKSIVAEPEAERIRVSVGRAPTGFGPYVEVPWSWEGPVGRVRSSEPARAPIARGHGGKALSRAERDTVRQYVEVTRLNMLGAEPHVLRELVEGLVQKAPLEPHFRTLAAFSAMQADDFRASARTPRRGAVARARRLSQGAPVTFQGTRARGLERSRGSAHGPCAAARAKAATHREDPARGTRGESAPTYSRTPTPPVDRLSFDRCARTGRHRLRRRSIE